MEGVGGWKGGTSSRDAAVLPFATGAPQKTQVKVEARVGEGGNCSCGAEPRISVLFFLCTRMMYPVS